MTTRKPSFLDEALVPSRLKALWAETETGRLTSEQFYAQQQEWIGGYAEIWTDKLLWPGENDLKHSLCVELGRLEGCDDLAEIGPEKAVEPLVGALRPGGILFGRFNVESDENHPSHIARDFGPIIDRLAELGFEECWHDEWLGWLGEHQAFRKVGETEHRGAEDIEMSTTSTELMLKVSSDLNANSSEELRPIEAYPRDEDLIPYYRRGSKLNRLKRISGSTQSASAVNGAFLPEWIGHASSIRFQRSR